MLKFQREKSCTEICQQVTPAILEIYFISCIIRREKLADDGNCVSFMINREHREYRVLWTCDSLADELQHAMSRVKSSETDN